MDPVTATMNTLGKFFDFLSTVEGQKLCADLGNEVRDIVKLFHQKSGAANLTAPTPPPPGAH